MRKIVSNLIIFIVILFIILIVILSTIGIETNKFNNLISEKATETKKINLELDTIKFKINPKELSLFLETQNPKIIYRKISVPVNNIKVYIDFLSLLKSDPKIKKISLVLEELDITQLNKLSGIMKPSNFKSLLNNKIKKGKLISKIEIFLTKDGDFKDFIAKGSVKDLKVELFKDFNFEKANLEFFADKNDILIKNIIGDFENIKILEGDIKLNFESGIKLYSNFNSKLNFDQKFYNKYSNFFDKYENTKGIKYLNADFNNNLFIDLDKTYKLKNYNYGISGKIEKGKFELTRPFSSDFLPDEIKTIYLSDSIVKGDFKPETVKFKGEGKYSLNDLDFLKINFENNFTKGETNLKLNFDYENSLKLDLINYKKNKNSTANIFLDLKKKQNNIIIEELNFEEKNNSINIDKIIIKKNKFISFKKVEVVTPNNNFSILNDKKILIKGSKFDATNLSKFFDSHGGVNIFEKISNKIEIDFQSIKAPMSENLKNFKLIGEIKEGKFIKISSKGDFGGNNFLDISMKKDKNSSKKYLEIYSDLTRPLLTEYSFFKGLSGGKLIFTSIIDDSKSNSKLKIENFKVVNAPGVIKLLSLADLGGLADLAEGEGLSFDVLEIDIEKNKNFLKLNEILALGPSISVLMDGYQDENDLTSLRGTLIPAKTLNKMISKIPVIGNIVIPKEVGEGLFGISFKMKGPKGNVKTTINPIRTLTPRFIQKIIDRSKASK
jgi:hypothetical protein